MYENMKKCKYERFHKYYIKSGAIFSRNQKPSLPKYVKDVYYNIISAPNCIKKFHCFMGLFWPIRLDVTIISNGNNCNVKSYWPEPPLEKRS